MARSMEQLYTDIVGHDVFIEKLSCMLGGLKEQIFDVDDVELAKRIPAEFTTQINAVFDRFERSRNKLQIALQTTGVMPAPEPDVKPTGEPKPKVEPAYKPTPPEPPHKPTPEPPHKPEPLKSPPSGRRP